MNKRLSLLIFIIIILIPSFIAVGYYSSTKREPSGKNEVTALKLVDLNGSSWSFEINDGAAAEEIIDMFVAMKNNASAAEAIPTAIKSKNNFLVTLTSFGTDHVYEYYFTEKASETYYADNAGNTYKIAEADAERFLSTPYAASVFTDGVLPLLIVGDDGGKTVSPSAASWSYFGYNGEEKKLDTGGLSSEDAVCSIVGKLALGFTDTPDYVHLVVTSGETTLYDGTIEGIDSLPLGDISEIYVEATAYWYLSEKVTNEVTYKFTGTIAAPAVFYLGQTSVNNGNFVVIGGKNVSRPGEIQFSSSPSIDYDPVFYQEGSYVYALVPIGYELESGADQTYKFTISYGGFSQTMELLVNSYSYGASNSKITAAVEAATYSEAARAEAEEALHELSKTEILTEHMFGKLYDRQDQPDDADNAADDTDVNEPADSEGAENKENDVFLRDIVGTYDSGNISPGFGRYITVTATGTQYRHTGCDFIADEGTPVRAVTSGKVVYSGYLTTTGYIVVIDHGWGLKSWYCHLSECSAEVGAEINKGDVIGLSGDTGFAAANRTHVGLTVGDVPVNIYDLWENPIAIPEMD